MMRTTGSAPARRRWQHVRRWANCVADALLPRACACCDRPLGANERGFCTGCIDLLPGARVPRCARCALPLGPGRRCTQCARVPAGADQTLALADYAPPLDRLILTLKFSGELAAARPLGEFAAQRLALELNEPPDVVTAVPLASARLAHRGYNQALEIARPIARGLGTPLRARLLHRLRDTTAQSTLDFTARAANLAGAFEADASANGQHVLVVDDVMTTGATLGAVALALRAAGARRVSALVAARTP